jgi:hypothetical protein
MLKDDRLIIEPLGVEVNKSCQLAMHNSQQIDGSLSFIEPPFSGSGGTMFSTARACALIGAVATGLSRQHTRLPRRTVLPSSSEPKLSSSSVKMRLCFQLAIADTALARAARFAGSCKLVASGTLVTEGSATGDRSAAFLRLETLPEASFADAADLDGVAAAGIAGIAASTGWSLSCTHCQMCLQTQNGCICMARIHQMHKFWWTEAYNKDVPHCITFSIG